MSNKVSLSISKINGKYSFSIQDHNRFPLAFEAFIHPPDQLRKEIAAKFNLLIEGASERMRNSLERSNRVVRFSEIELATEIGNEVSEFLVPKEIVKILSEIKPKSILLTTNDPYIPWELTRFNGRFMSEITAIGKCVKTSRILDAIRPYKSKRRISVLMISNPTCDLAGADKEFELLCDFFNNDIHFELTTLHRQKATLRNLIAALRENEFDIIHYAGHTLFDNKTRNDPQFFLNDTRVSASYLANLFENGKRSPSFLFLNSCTSAVIDNPSVYHNYLEGITPYFLHSGVIGIIGALWPVVDEHAIDIALRFYASISLCRPIGEALSESKKAKIVDGQSHATWVGYTLVGDPELTLVNDTDWKIMKTKSDGFDAARSMFSGKSRLALGGVHPFLMSSIKHDTVLVALASYCKKCEAIVVPSNSQCHTLEDLLGKNIGVTPFTSMEVFLKHAWLDHGLKIKDLKLIFLNNQEILPALENGHLDAAVVWEPWLEVMMMKDYRKIYSDNTDTNGTICGLATRRQYLEENRLGILQGVRNYYHCVNLIQNGYLNHIQLLSLQFGMKVDTLQASFMTFDFLGLEKSFEEENIKNLTSYLSKEIEFLQQMNLLQEELSLKQIWNPFSYEELKNLEIKKCDLEISVQQSISCTPLILGRFLNLYK